MTESVDTKIILELSRIFNFPLNRIIYGSYDVARLYWATYLSSHRGVEELPFMSFFRNITFHDTSKKTEQRIAIIDYDDKSKEVSYLPCYINYTIEVATAKISEQNKIIKKYMLWAGSESAISFLDSNLIPWKFRILPEDAEDNSDLQSENEMGRIVRTSIPFKVESILLDRGEEIAGPINEILANVHLYNGITTEQSKNILDINIQE